MACMKNKIILLTLLLCPHNFLNTVSLVYNLKIRRSFSVHKFLQTNKKFLWLISAVPVIYQRKSHVVRPERHTDVLVKEFLGGSLFNVRLLAPHNWWAELTMGVERQTSKVCGTQNFKASRTGLDDIVLTAGKNFMIGKKGQIALYGLCGFPTWNRVTPSDDFGILVGTRCYGAGFGAEGSYSFMKSLKRSLSGIIQTRFVHFFNRHWNPILPCTAKIMPGNATDLFMIMQYREKRNIFEVGYNATFFTQLGVETACKKEYAPNLVRNSLYTSYTHVFPKSFLFHRPGTIGVGFNYGRTNIFDTKNYSLWVNMSLLF